jgi:hypothetical protein
LLEEARECFSCHPVEAPVIASKLEPAHVRRGRGHLRSVKRIGMGFEPADIVAARAPIVRPGDLEHVACDDHPCHAKIVWEL